MYISQPNRAAQDSAQMYNCLLNSLSVEGLAKITVWEDEYMVRNIGSGPYLLKVIIRESDIDSNATIRNIRNKLAQLDTYLPTIGFDICKLNMYVQNLMREL